MFDYRRRTVGFLCAFLLACGFALNAKALVPAQEVVLPSVQGSEIKAVKRFGKVMCSARPKEEDAIKLTLLADTGKYRGGVWYLGVSTRIQHLQPDVDGEAAAHLSLEGKRVVSGKVLAVGEWADNKRTATYVSFEFTAIDAYVKDIKAARVVELQAQGLRPLKLDGLPALITALEQCQQEAANPQFWKDAERVCR